MANEERKGRILDYVSSYSDDHGYAPTYREIGDAVGLRSTSSGSDYIKLLRDEGKLDMTAKKPRAVTLNRRIPMQSEEPQRLRVELADGGIFFIDCAVKHTDNNNLAVVLSGIMDASHLKGNIGSVVGCTVDNG